MQGFSTNNFTFHQQHWNIALSKFHLLEFILNTHSYLQIYQELAPCSHTNNRYIAPHPSRSEHQKFLLILFLKMLHLISNKILNPNHLRFRKQQTPTTLALSPSAAYHTLQLKHNREA